MKTYSRLQAKRHLPKRSTSSNKTKGGKVLIIAGSEGMEGAAILAARAAARSGAGYVYLYSSSNIFSNIFPLFKNPDFLTLKSRKAFRQINFSSVAIGPGFKNKNEIKYWLSYLITENFQNVVLDAEALNYISRSKSLKMPKTWILTPHEGELSRLLKVSSRTISKNREKYVRLAQKKFGCIVLLKGYGTLVATENYKNPANRIRKIPTGNKALAKAGTGDVLTGIIAAMLSQNVLPFEAACLGAYLHGFISDRWILSGNDYLSLMASDLIELLPNSLRLIRR